MELKDILVKGDAKATAIKLLDVLEGEGKIWHIISKSFDNQGQLLSKIHSGSCWLCNLQKLLKEG